MLLPRCARPPPRRIQSERPRTWGLGATLHHAATGENPFPREPDAAGGEDLTVRFPQLVEEPELLGQNFPPRLESLVMRMLARHPDERPAAEEVAGVLESFLDGLPRRPRRSRKQAR